jgi:peptidyl-prolyl cis-trans isomerase D
MLSFFRRIINSKYGIVVTFITLGVIALAFAAGDVSNLGIGKGGGLGNNEVAEVGKRQITGADLRQAAQDELEAARQQQPTLDMAGFLAGGGLEGTLERTVTTDALAEFGRSQGMVVSKRLVDGQIASIPALQGPNGKFDEQLYRRILAERKLTDARIRGDIARSTLVQQLTGPTIGATQVGQQLALPYASLLLEKRAGQIGFIPAAAVTVGAAPTPAELQTFYARNLSRYRVPERRTIRYALVTPAAVAASAVPSDAEIAQAYNQDRAKYQPSEKRTIAQVVIADQAGAAALDARVRAGTPIAAAAKAAGLDAATSTGDKATYAAANNAALADALFAGTRGAVIGPVRGPFGFVVARIDAIEQVPGRTIAQARDEIAKALGTRKAAAALADLRNKLEDAVGGNATFDEAVKDARLDPRTTAALTAQGTDPANPAAQPDPALAPIVAAAFQASDGDAPQVVPTGQDGSFAVVAIGQIAPAAPRPLDQVRAQVLADLVADRRRQAARRLAAAVLAKVNGGTPLGAALGQTGVRTPPVQPLAAARADLARAQGPAQAPLALLFSMVQGSAKLLEAPGSAGWLVVKLDRIDRGDASKVPAAVAAARRDIGQLMGREYAEQFARAARNAVGVKTDTAAVARVRAELAGNGTGG